MKMNIEELKNENRALRTLVEWAIDCGFWFDSFPEEYKMYKNELTEDMNPIDCMIHIAKRFEEDAEIH